MKRTPPSGGVNWSRDVVGAGYWKGCRMKRRANGAGVAGVKWDEKRQT